MTTLLSTRINKETKSFPRKTNDEWKKSRNRKIKIEHLKEKQKKEWNLCFACRKTINISQRSLFRFKLGQVRINNLPQNFSTVNHFNIFTDVENDRKLFNSCLTHFKYNIINIIYNIILIQYWITFKVGRYSSFVPPKRDFQFIFKENSFRCFLMIFYFCSQW